MGYDYEYIRDELHRDFNDESITLVLSLRNNDARGAERAAQMIASKYRQQKNKCAELERHVQYLEVQNRQLEEKVHNLQKECNNKVVVYKAPNYRDLDDAAMYADLLKTKSYRATGRNFGCYGRTVKSHLIEAGYDVEAIINKGRH